MANVYKMTHRDIQQLVLLRSSNAAIFTGRKHSAMRGWRAIRREMGLQGLVSTRQLKKKWDNLNQKYRAIKNPPEGENPRSPKSWPWYFLMDESASGRLNNTARVIQLLPIDDEKQEADLPAQPSPESEDVLSALDMVEMAPIEQEEDVEMLYKSSSYDGTNRPDGSPQRHAPRITVKTLESVPSVPKTASATTQEPSELTPVLYARLLPDSTAPLAGKGPDMTSTGFVVRATADPESGNNDEQNCHPTALLYATLLPDSTATSVTKTCTAPSPSVAREFAELHKKLAELKREKLTLEKEQAAFDQELIKLESEREQLNNERQTLHLDRIEIERDWAVLDKNKADLEREKAGVERDKLLLDRDRAYLDRDRAFFERDKVFLDKVKEDFERQKEQQGNLSKKMHRNPSEVPEAEEDNGGEATIEQEYSNFSEKCSDLTNKVIEVLTSEGDQQEARRRFATLVQKLVEKL